MKTNERVPKCDCGRDLYFRERCLNEDLWECGKCQWKRPVGTDALGYTNKRCGCGSVLSFVDHIHKDNVSIYKCWSCPQKREVLLC